MLRDLEEISLVRSKAARVSARAAEEEESFLSPHGEKSEHGSRRGVAAVN